MDSSAHVPVMCLTFRGQGTSVSRAERPGAPHTAAKAKGRRDFRKGNCREDETRKGRTSSLDTEEG